MTLLFLLSCAAPWTTGAGPSEIPPAAAKQKLPANEPHTVKNEAQVGLDRAVKRFVPAYQKAGSPTVGLLVLSPSEAPFETWKMLITGMYVEGGEIKTGSTTLAPTEPLPGLATSGWKEQAADVLQSTLVDAGVKVVDLPVAGWKADDDALPADLVFELRWVSAEPMPEAQLRAIRLKTGEVLCVERAPIAGDDVYAFGRAARRVLAGGLESLAGRI